MLLLTIQQAFLTALYLQTDRQTEDTNGMDWPNIRMAIRMEALRKFFAEWLGRAMYNAQNVKFWRSSSAKSQRKIPRDVNGLNKKLENNYCKAQGRQNLHADKQKSEEASFDVEHEALLCGKILSLETSSSGKLLSLWVGPFEMIERAGEVA